MKSAWAIARRELLSTFCSPVAYVVAFVFLLVSGYTFWMLLSALNNPRALVNGAAMQLFFGGTLFFWLNVIVITAALTMRLFAEEAKSGTLELLLTAPVTDGEVVLGKFLGAFLFYLMLWLPTLVYPAALGFVSSPDWGPVACGYLGVVLLGALFLSIGLFASSLTKNQIIAAVLAFTACVALFSLSFLDFFVPLSGWKPVFNYVNMIGHFDDFGKGVVDTRVLAYYGTLTGFFLFLAWKRLQYAK